MHLEETALEETDGLRFRFVVEREIKPSDHAAISALLVAAFPEHAEIFRTASWYPGRPDYRLWIEDLNGVLVVHLNFEQRSVGVGDEEVMVTGVGGVAAHPRICRETGFGYLGCREEVVDFYERADWSRIDQETREIDPATER